MQTIECLLITTKPTHIYEYNNLRHIHEYVRILRSQVTNTRSAMILASKEVSKTKRAEIGRNTYVM